MHDPIHLGPTVGAQALRALARYPDRIAFVEGDRRTTYAATLDLVARIQAVYAAQGLGRGDRIAILTANRSEAWCASVAAQASAMSITWLHPLGSLDDQVEQIVDGECSALLVDDANFLARGAEIAARVVAEAFDYLDAPPARVFQKDVPLPYAANLEALSLPGKDDIVKAAKQVCYVE